MERLPSRSDLERDLTVLAEADSILLDQAQLGAVREPGTAIRELIDLHPAPAPIANPHLGHGAKVPAALKVPIPDAPQS